MVFDLCCLQITQCSAETDVVLLFVTDVPHYNVPLQLLKVWDHMCSRGTTRRLFISASCDDVNTTNSDVHIPQNSHKLLLPPP